MSAAKVAIMIDQELLRTVDRWVAQGRYRNRSQAIQSVLREKSERWKHNRFRVELAKLNPKEEQTLSEEWLTGEAWAGS